jgi:hypothetical protein
MFDKFQKEFAPKRPQTQPEGLEQFEQRLRQERAGGLHEELAQAIEIMKSEPGVKQFLVAEKGEIGLKVGGRFLKTGEYFRHESLEAPTKSVQDFKSLKVMSVNVGRFNEGGNTASLKTQFMEFINSHFVDGADVLCLQDFRLDTDRDVLKVLGEAGFDYYVNTFGQSKDKNTGEFKELANVTIVNPKRFAGYNLSLPYISVTPNFQRVRKVEKVGGRRIAKYLNAEARWDLNYAGEEKYLEHNHFAFQALNTEFRLQGVDGDISINIGNIYNAPPSQVVDRIKSVMSSMKNLNKSEKGFQILMGDFNTYGVDSARHINGQAAFSLKGIMGSAVYNQLFGKMPEIKLLNKRLARQGLYRLNKLGENNSGKTIFKGPGKTIGLRVDNAMASNYNTLTSCTINVPFTDHRVLVVEATRA